MQNMFLVKGKIIYRGTYKIIIKIFKLVIAIVYRNINDEEFLFASVF